MLAVMKAVVALGASSLLLVAIASVVGCEGDVGNGGQPATFDAGGFDSGSGPGPDGSTSDDGGTSTDGGDGGEGGITPPPTTPNDVYVDPVGGLDANSGKSGTPFKSLTKAFSVVPGGAGVHLLDGTYNAANESGLVVTIPADVNVRSENPRMAKITGLTVKTTGGATALYDLVFVDSPQLNALGTTKLLGANLTFLPNGDNIMNVNDSAEVTLVGGTLDGQGTGAAIIGTGLFRVLGTGSLTLDGIVMKNTKAPGIRLDGPAPTTKAKLVVKNAAVFDGIGSTGNGCLGGSAISAGNNASVLLDHVTIKSSLGAAVCVGESVDVTVQDSAFTENNIGVNAQDGITTAGSSLKVRSSVFTNNTRGIAWLAAGKVDLSDTTFTALPAPAVTKIGIQLFAGGPGLTAVIRKTVIHGYGYGVQLFTGGPPFTVDLGTGGNPGNNDFSGNTVSCLRDELPVGSVLDAQGNTWTASVQNADAAGHFPVGTVLTGPQTTGTNFYIGTASTLNL